VVTSVLEELAAAYLFMVYVMMLIKKYYIILIKNYYIMSFIELMLVIVISEYCIIPCLIYRFQKASEVLTGLMKAVANKRWDEAHTYGQQAREHFRTVIEDSAQK
jgi:hypothetical protein